MKNDPLAPALGQYLKEEQEDEDPRWLELAHGQLTAKERDELLKDHPQDGALMAELCAPLSEEYLANISEAEAPAATSAKVISWPKPIISTLSISLLVAAAVVFFRISAPQPLGNYRAHVAAGEQQWRSERIDNQKPGLFRSQTPIEITLRPASKVEGPVETKVFLQQGSKWMEVAAKAEVSALGAIRLQTTIQKLGISLNSGPFQLHLVVAQPGALPPSNQILGSSNASSWQKYSFPMHFAP